jgi:hypothetical protein
VEPQIFADLTDSTEKRLSQKTYGFLRQPILFLLEVLFKEKLSFSLKSTSKKENYLAANNDEGVMRRPPFFIHSKKNAS